MDSKDLERAALDFANALRINDDRPTVDSMSPGVARDCAGCPVARTAGNLPNVFPQWEIGKAGALKVGARGGVKANIPVPSAVIEFMAAFDAGAYPELVAQPQPVMA